MALSGTITNDTTLKGREYYMEWTAVQNVAGNYSDITVRHYLYNKPLYDLYISARDNSCRVDGIYDSYRSPAISTGGNSVISLGTTTHRVYHNADGSKSAGISGTFYIQATLSGVYVDSVTASGTIELNRIPRSAQITNAPDFTDEENPVIEYVNNAGDLITAVQAAITSAGGGTVYAAYRSVPTAGGAYTFTLTNAERTALQNACTGKSMPVEFRLKSTLGGVDYYSYVAKTLTIANAAPTLAPQVTDINTATTALTGNANVIVNGQSNARYVFMAAAKKGASIVSYRITNGDQVATAATGTINGATSNVFTFMVTDSRGYVVSVDVIKQFANYFTPNITLKAGTPNAAGACRLQVSGNCFNGSFGATANACNVYYKHSTDGGTTWDAPQALTVTQSGNTFSVDQVITGLDYRLPHTFTALITDSITTVETTPQTVRAFPLFDWGAADFAFNCPVSVDGGINAETVDAGQYLINGEPLTVSGVITANGVTNGWTWYKWDNGLFICWQSKTFNSVTFSTTGSYYRRGSVSVPAAPFDTAEVRGMVFNDGNYSGYGWSGNQFTAFGRSVDVYSTAAGTINSVGVQFVALGRWQ